MKILAHVQYDTKTVQLFRSADIGMLNLHLRRDTKCQTVAKIQEKVVVRLWSSAHV